MKRALTLGVGALALAGMSLPSSAADLGARPITKAPVAAPPVVYNWTGCYIGANAGGKWGRFTGDETVAVVPVAGTLVFANTGNNNGDFMGGGQIGCQWQTGAWVFGIEGDGDATSIRRSFVAPATVFFPFLPGDTFDVKNDWQASVRGRLGYAWDRWMIYATGGVAFANIDATIGFVPAPFAFPTLFLNNSRTLTGFTVGGGVEYAILDNLSLGIEYRFSDFGRDNFAFGTPVIFGVPVTGRSDLQTNEVTARLNWHFNWFNTPVAARY